LPSSPEDTLDGQEEPFLNDDVMIAVDPHKASNTAVVLDPVSKTVVESVRFANTTDGYAQLTAFAGRWSQRRWAVEGCFGTAGGSALRDIPAAPEREARRPNNAPAYYLGRPAAVWITAMRPHRRRTAARYLMEAAVSGDNPARDYGVVRHS
jgi:hypothetical protein